MANEKIEEAKKLYQQGKALSEIASIMGVSPSTVRSWKSRGNWDNNVATQRNVAKKRCNEKFVENKLIQSVENNSKLTDQQKAFCLHYVKTFNATMAYKKAYGCDYASASAAGSRLLTNVNIRAEITRLKQIRSMGILATADDVVDRYMKIAFSDISDYVEWGRATVPVMGPFGPLSMKDEKTGLDATLTHDINEVRFKESSEVDGTLVSEVKQGKDGASVKLADRMKALEWLSNYFELNPSDQHKREYDKRRLEIDLLKAQSGIKVSNDDAIPDDGFKAALDGKSTGLWSNGDNANPEWEEQSNNDVDGD